MRYTTPPTADDIAPMENGARLFARHTPVSLPLAVALAQHGRKELAQKLLAEGAIYGRDEATRGRMVEVGRKLGLAVGP